MHTFSSSIESKEAKKVEKHLFPSSFKYYFEEKLITKT